MSMLSSSVLEQLRQITTTSTERFVIAYSGGCDSHVLLHVVASAMKTLPVSNIHAIHINHGLQKDSAGWAEHCKKICNDLGVTIDIVDLKLSVPKGESIEAYARQQRYQALQQRLTCKDICLLAQHQDDQVETFFLQMLRGAGVKGLSSMPANKTINGIRYFRPLLNLTRKDILEYASQQQLNWIDDPSNDDTRFDRNYLRHDVIPVLKQRWPALNDMVMRVTSHQAEAAECLNELAALDFRSEQDDPQSLNMELLLNLSPARAKNLVRYWIESCALPLPDSTTLERIFSELVHAAADAEPLISWSGVNLRRYRNTLHIDQQQSVIPRDWSAEWDIRAPLELPLGQQLHVRQVEGEGLCLPESGHLTVKFRQGGEKCQLPGRAHRHELKKLMQDWGIPPWQRGAIPLIFVGDEIAQIVGYSLCEPFVAKSPQTGLDIYLKQ